MRINITSEKGYYAVGIGNKYIYFRNAWSEPFDSPIVFSLYLFGIRALEQTNLYSISICVWGFEIGFGVKRYSS